MNVQTIAERLHSYIGVQLTRMAADSPIIAFAKPVLVRVIDNNIGKLEGSLKLIADKNGEIDVDAILTEMLDSVMNTKPFTINTSFTGDIEIGGGLIKMNIPVINKRVMFNLDDLREFKELLTK